MWKLKVNLVGVIIQLRFRDIWQVFTFLNINFIHFSESMVTLNLTRMEKTSRNVSNTRKFTFEKFSEDKNLCIYTILKHYINTTQGMRKSEFVYLIQNF